MDYLAVLGRQPEISIAELEALFGRVQRRAAGLASFDASAPPAILRLGGSLKLAKKLPQPPLDYLTSLPEGKITLGVSDYSRGASTQSAARVVTQLKRTLARQGRSVRVLPNKSAVLSSAASLHNGLGSANPRKLELIKVEKDYYRVIGVQDIDAYARRDQARPARDARVGMLPPKLAQILINLCGPLPAGSRILDPFCGTGVVLQEALLMGYAAYGTDLDPRMVEYSERNLNWLLEKSRGCPFRGNSERGSARTSAPPPWRPPLGTRTSSARRAVATRPEKGQLEIFPSGSGSCDPSPKTPSFTPKAKQFCAPGDGPAGRGPRKGGLGFRAERKAFETAQGDATSFVWNQPIDAVACEAYLGSPMSQPPAEIKLKTEKAICQAIILGFLKNLAPQITHGTPVTLAAPAWLRPSGAYSRLFDDFTLDEAAKLGYNVSKKSRTGLLYHREGQVVARDIIILRKI